MLGGSAPLVREIERGKRAWYMRRVLPYRTQDDRVEGVVVTYSDISETKAAESAIEAARAYSDGIVDTVRQPLAVLDAELRVISASRSFYRSFSVKPEETVGRQLGAVNDRHLDVPAMRAFLERLQAGETQIKDYEIEIDLPSTGRRSLLVNTREIRRQPLAERQILVSLEDVTERHRVAASVGSSQAAGGPGQSREIAISRRRQPRPPSAAANHRPVPGHPGEETQGRGHVEAGRQARRDPCAPCRAC